MKTLFKTFAYAAIAALALSSCAKEKLQPADELTGKLVTVHFGTENTDPSTKATLTPDADETAFQAAWENGDVLSVYYINGNIKDGTVPAIWDGSKFSAKLPEYTGEWEYKAAYPVPDATDNHVDFGSNRTQKGNAYNSKYDIMVGKAVAKNAAAGKDDSGKDIVFEMDRQTAIAYFHFTSDLDEAITSATLTVDGDGAAIASSSAHISNFVWDASEDLTSITITFPEKAPNAQDFQLWFNVLPTSYSSMTLTVETDTKTFTISKKSEGLYEAGKLYKVKKDGISWTDKIFFYESFDQTSGTGGNDNAWSGSIASNKVVYDNEGWVVSNEGGASKCLRLGSGSKKGSATTPSLGIKTSEATLSFKAAAWNASNEKTTIKLSIIGAGTISPTSVNLAKGQWSEYDCTITGADATTKIKFEAANAADNRFFIDEVYVYSGTTTAGSGSGEGGGETGGGETGGGETGGGETDWSKTYTSNVGISGATVIIGGVEYDAIQVGSSSSKGSKTFKVPANTTKLYLHVVGWNGEDNKTHTIKTSVGTISSSSIKTTADSGASNQSPFTLSSNDYSSSKYFYEFTLSGVTSEATITISNSAGKSRGVYFGINAK